MQSHFAQDAKVPYLIAPSRKDLGKRAAADVAAELRACVARQGSVRMIFAAAPSQAEMLAALIVEPGIDWKRVTAFHMDEYLGLSQDAPQRFASWLDRHLFTHVPFAAIHRMQPDINPEEFAEHYSAALAEAPIDIVCCGIGANGHLAFNDPPAEFNDVKSVKIVSLDDACRQQQVDDLCFSSLEQVPMRALTLTVPRLLASGSIFCCVPGSMKSKAVRLALTGPLSEECPASALRTHPNCKVYLDPDSAAGLATERTFGTM
jgi:glucosamine-6-phosphate deaminase